MVANIKNEKLMERKNLDFRQKRKRRMSQKGGLEEEWQKQTGKRLNM